MVQSFLISEKKTGMGQEQMVPPEEVASDFNMSPV